MHQPYYKNLLTNEVELPWVRLHGVKDYLDMVEMLKDYPLIKQTFNVVPSLFEQIEDFAHRDINDKFLKLSYKAPEDLTAAEKQFILENFFSINKEKVISVFPRYYELHFKKQKKQEFSAQDYLDLQVLFNLAWIDPHFRRSIPELKAAVSKGRFFNAEDKQWVLFQQIEILKKIIPSYKKALESGQIEISLTPYYHPILPLLYNTNIAKEANIRTNLPHKQFNYPEDARRQIDTAIKFYTERFEVRPLGMWPSEEAVSEHILPFIIQAGISWIVADEAILFKSLGVKKRDTALLYQPHLLKREDGELNIVFRDRNLSDLIGFTYHRMQPEDAVADFLQHLKNISLAFKDKDILVTVALDGENAWEYYSNDGQDFLNLLYRRLSEADFLKTITVSEYLKTHTSAHEIKRLAAGSWIYGEFSKWIGHPAKIKAWECLAEARAELENIKASPPKAEKCQSIKVELAERQMDILEGSDWFWWYGEDPTGDFDRLFRMHLSNFYTLIGKEAPACSKIPL